MIPALLLAIAAPTGFPAAAPVTIEEVRADPRKWDGKWVRFQGYIHRCSALDCAVAERPANGGMLLSIESAPSFDAWIARQLPAKVEVTARIDAECLISFCTDRAPQLRQVYVETLAAHIDKQD